MRFYMIFGLFLLTTGLSAQQYSSRYASSSNNSETGTAVYYADYLHGRITAMGEVYRREEYTAAHKTYPKGTLLKVTRLDNGLSTVVRVNDRGPFVEGLMIDISKAAAMDIGLLRDGKAQVRIEPVGHSDQNPRGGQLTAQTTARSAPQSYDSYASRSNRVPAYSSSSYEPQYPATATQNSYASRSTNTSDYTAKGGTNRYSAYNSAPPVGRAYSNENMAYSQPTQSGRTYTEPYSNNVNLTAKGGYPTNQPQSYGQVGGSLASRAPGAAQTSSGSSTSATTLPRGTQGYAVQVGSYRNAENAARQVEELQAKGLSNVFIMDSNGLQKVVIAAFPQKAAAQNYLDDLRRSFMIDGLVTMIR
ncbi:MAG: septal ring lytic transglycosylase RlpA family protein [Phaeodactylibacter xiamenensis]|uniref:septal ring lytic transglycosylase RlpA family protein n=1 Tax=Phaeodactylibacter xiamenensis TaxID=1524460 RepID=UPI0006969509|nr:septal ring lytic transglycosylase RlpA family protein [Phaeodactylibacter xiamenensis]MCR9050234.1 septal ring lytic transglycosylase RlpA family protein [bacterium]